MHSRRKLSCPLSTAVQEWALTTQLKLTCPLLVSVANGIFRKFPNTSHPRVLYYDHAAPPLGQGLIPLPLFLGGH